MSEAASLYLGIKPRQQSLITFKRDVENYVKGIRLEVNVGLNYKSLNEAGVNLKKLSKGLEVQVSVKPNEASFTAFKGRLEKFASSLKLEVPVQAKTTFTGGSKTPTGSSGTTGQTLASSDAIKREISQLENLYRATNQGGQQAIQRLEQLKQKALTLQGLFEPGTKEAQRFAKAASEAQMAVERIGKKELSLIPKGDSAQAAQALKNQVSQIENLYRATGQGAAQAVTQLQKIKAEALQSVSALQAGSREAKQLAQAAGNAERAIERINGTSPFGKLSNDISSINTKLPAFTGNIGSVGTILTGITRIAGPAGLALYGVAKGLQLTIPPAAELEDALQGAKLTLEATSEQAERLSKINFTLGPSLGYTAAQVAKIEEQLGSAGLTAEQVLGGAAKSVVEFGRATDTNLTKAGATIGQTVANLKLTGASLGRIADVYTVAAQKSLLTAEDLADGVGQGAAIFNDWSSEVKDGTERLVQFATALSIARDKTNSASDAGTSLKSFFLAIRNPTEKAIELMQKYGISFYNLDGSRKRLSDIAQELEKLNRLTPQQRDGALGVLFGSDGARTAIGLLERGRQGVLDLARDLGKPGEAAKIAAERMNTFKAANASLKAEFNALASTIGTVFLPVATKVTQWLTDLVKTSKNKITITIEAFVKPVAETQKARADLEALLSGKATPEQQATAAKNNVAGLQALIKEVQQGPAATSDPFTGAIIRRDSLLKKLNQELELAIRRQESLLRLQNRADPTDLQSTLNQFAKGKQVAITQLLGANPNNGIYGPGGHEGLDFVNPGGIGAAVFNPFERATVLAVGNLEKAGIKGGKAYGNGLLLGFEDGTKAILGHFNSLSVKVGDILEKDAFLGGQGRSGTVAGTKAELAANPNKGVHVHLTLIAPDGSFIRDASEFSGKLKELVAQAVKPLQTSPIKLTAAQIQLQDDRDYQNSLAQARRLVKAVSDERAKVQATTDKGQVPQLGNLRKVEAELNAFLAKGNKERRELAVEQAKEEERIFREALKARAGLSEDAAKDEKARQKELAKIRADVQFDSFKSALEGRTQAQLIDLQEKYGAALNDSKASIDAITEAKKRLEAVDSQIERNQDRASQKAKETAEKAKADALKNIEERQALIKELNFGAFENAVANKAPQQIGDLLKLEAALENLIQTNQKAVRQAKPGTDVSGFAEGLDLATRKLEVVQAKVKQLKEEAKDLLNKAGDNLLEGLEARFDKIKTGLLDTQNFDAFVKEIGKLGTDAARAKPKLIDPEQIKELDEFIRKLRQTRTEAQNDKGKLINDLNFTRASDKAGQKEASRLKAIEQIEEAQKKQSDEAILLYELEAEQLDRLAEARKLDAEDLEKQLEDRAKTQKEADEQAIEDAQLLRDIELEQLERLERARELAADDLKQQTEDQARADKEAGEQAIDDAQLLREIELEGLEQLEQARKLTQDALKEQIKQEEEYQDLINGFDLNQRIQAETELAKAYKTTALGAADYAAEAEALDKALLNLDLEDLQISLTELQEDYQALQSAIKGTEEPTEGQLASSKRLKDAIEVLNKAIEKRIALTEGADLNARIQQELELAQAYKTVALGSRDFAREADGLAQSLTQLNLDDLEQSLSETEADYKALKETIEATKEPTEEQVVTFARLKIALELINTELAKRRQLTDNLDLAVRVAQETALAEAYQKVAIAQSNINDELRAFEGATANLEVSDLNSLLSETAEAYSDVLEAIQAVEDETPTALLEQKKRLEGLLDILEKFIRAKAKAIESPDKGSVTLGLDKEATNELGELETKVQALQIALVNLDQSDPELFEWADETLFALLDDLDARIDALAPDDPELERLRELRQILFDIGQKTFSEGGPIPRPAPTPGGDQGNGKEGSEPPSTAPVKTGLDEATLEFDKGLRTAGFNFLTSFPEELGNAIANNVAPRFDRIAQTFLNSIANAASQAASTQFTGAIAGGASLAAGLGAINPLFLIAAIGLPILGGLLSRMFGGGDAEQERKNQEERAKLQSRSTPAINISAITNLTIPLQGDLANAGTRAAIENMASNITKRTLDSLDWQKFLREKGVIPT